MRYFLGFDVNPKTKLAMQGWRDKSLPTFNNPVPAANFHVTAVFLGQITDRQLDNLSSNINPEILAPCSLHLDMMGFWSKPRVLWLGSHSPPTALMQMQHSIAETCQSAGIELSHKHYCPHVTLARKITDNPPAPLMRPSFTIDIDCLHLFESVSTKSGVRYPIRQSWKMQQHIGTFHRSPKGLQ